MITRCSFTMHTDSYRIHHCIIKRKIITGKIYRVIGDAIRPLCFFYPETYGSIHETAILPEI